MKKNVKTLIAVITVIVLLVAGITFVLKSGTGEETQPVPTSTPVPRYDAYKVERDNIDNFVINLTSESITFKNTGDGTWSINDTPYDELDDSKIETLLGSVCTMMSNHEVEKGVSDLSQYGLDNPYVTIDVARVDGSIDRLLIGEKSPTLGEYFFTVDGSGNIYTIYEYKVDTITKASSYYKTFDRFNLAVEDVTNIKFERRDMDNLEMRLKDITEDDGYSIVWEIVQPYNQVVNGIDQFINDEILTDINNLAISAPAEAGLDYGFENPSAKVTVTIEPYNPDDGTKGEAYTREFVIGNTVDDNSYVQYQGKAYVVPTVDLEFVYTEPFLAVSKLQALVDIQHTDKVTVTTKSGKTEIDIAHGETPSDLSFKVNGREADASASRKAYQEIIAMNVSDLYKGENIGETEVTIDYNGYNGFEDVKIELKTINELNYALTRNGETYFVIKKTTVDEMLTKLNEYVQNPTGA